MDIFQTIRTSLNIRNFTSSLRGPVSPMRVAVQMINLEKPNGFSTIVVVGNGRGGTSAIAGALTILGVPMGKNRHEYNHEDLDIIFASRQYQNVEGDNHTEQLKNNALFNIITARNNEFNIWGWKDPSADLYLPQILSALRAPRIIFVNRDLAAVAESIYQWDRSKVRNKNCTVETHISIEQSFALALERTKRYWEICQIHCLPTLVVSFERAKSKPMQAVEAIVAFSGITASKYKKLEAAKFMSGARYKKIGWSIF